MLSEHFVVHEACPHACKHARGKFLLAKFAAGVKSAKPRNKFGAIQQYNVCGLSALMAELYKNLQEKMKGMSDQDVTELQQ